LPETAWYSVAVLGFAAGETWQGSIGLEASSDDYPDTITDAFPIAIGSNVGGSLTPGDVDAFQVDVPTGSATYFSLSGHSASVVYEVRSASNSVLMSGVMPPGSAQFMLPVGVGRYIVRLSSASTTNYAAEISEWCGTLCYPNNFLRSAQFSAWGDRFAASLGAAHSHQFTISLAEGEVVSASVTEAPGCSLELQTIPSAAMRRFSQEIPLFRWRDGGPALDINGWYGRAPHGSIRAPLAGTYTFRVVNQVASACPQYLFEFMRSNSSTPTLPPW